MKEEANGKMEVRKGCKKNKNEQNEWGKVKAEKTAWMRRPEYPVEEKGKAKSK